MEELCSHSQWISICASNKKTNKQTKLTEVNRFWFAAVGSVMLNKRCKRHGQDVLTLPGALPSPSDLSQLQRHTEIGSHWQHAQAHGAKHDLNMIDTTAKYVCEECSPLPSTIVFMLTGLDTFNRHKELDCYLGVNCRWWIGFSTCCLSIQYFYLLYVLLVKTLLHVLWILICYKMSYFFINIF